nr:hypothetical protein [Tanacetum cinerariifolium]
MKGVGFSEYCAVPPPPAQVYSPPKKDLSWMGLPEFVDDIFTDHTRPTPSIDVSKSDKVSFEEEFVHQRLRKTLTHVLELSSCFYLDDRAWGVLNFDLAGDKEELRANNGLSYVITAKAKVTCLSSAQSQGGSVMLSAKIALMANLSHYGSDNLAEVNIKKDESMLWHRRLGHLIFKTMNKLVRSNLVKEIENLKDLNVKIIRSDNEGEFRNKEMDELCSRKVRTMLADAKLPVTFWAEAVNTACKFDAKGDEVYFIRYSINSKAFRVFNKRTKKIKENLHADFLENRSIEKGIGPDWLFDIDTSTNSMNYVPVVAGTSSTNISSTKEDEKESPLRFIALLNWLHEAQMATSNEAAKKDDAILDNNAPQKEQEEVNGDKDLKAVGTQIPLL